MPRLMLTLAATSAMLALTACTAPSPQPAELRTVATSPTETPAPVEPAALKPDGTAADNLPFFDSIAQSVVAATPDAGGEAFINALVAAGFAKADMEVGFDRTSVDLAADSVQWSVRFNGECLIGQFGPASGGYHSIVTPILATGSCLIGTTRPIDW